MSRKHAHSMGSYNKMKDTLHTINRRSPSRSLTHKKNMTKRQQIQSQAVKHMRLQLKQLANRIFNR